MTFRGLAISLVMAFSDFGCGLGSLENRIEYRVLAIVEKFSVPDSSAAGNIRVTMAGLLGRTTAYSFSEIVSQRKDTLFEFAVYGRYVEEDGKSYEVRDIRFDTTLVLSLSPPRTKMHYFRIVGANGEFSDSSFVHQ